MRDAELHSFAQVVLKLMNGNINFPSPVPTFAIFETTVESYGTALVNAGDRSRTAIAVKNALKLDVSNGLRNWAQYVNILSDGDAEKIASSGLKEAKQREPLHIAAPVIKKIMQGINPGELLVQVQKTKGVKSFNYMITKDPITESTEWQVFGDSRSKFLFENLEQGAKYWIKVVAIGSNNQATESEEVAQYVMKRNAAGSKAA